MVVALAPSPVVMLLGLALACVGMKSMLPTFWTLPTSFLSGAAAAGGIALINSVANLGGLLGPTIMGQFQARTGTSPAALWSWPRPWAQAAPWSFLSGMIPPRRIALSPAQDSR